jgi:hypothetical protein
MSHNNTDKKCEIDSKTKGKIMFQGNVSRKKCVNFVSRGSVEKFNIGDLKG